MRQCQATPYHASQQPRKVAPLLPDSMAASRCLATVSPTTLLLIGGTTRLLTRGVCRTGDSNCLIEAAVGDGSTSWNLKIVASVQMPGDQTVGVRSSIALSRISDSATVVDPCILHRTLNLNYFKLIDAACGYLGVHNVPRNRLERILQDIGPSASTNSLSNTDSLSSCIGRSPWPPFLHLRAPPASRH